jgi:hypothetical protein
VFTEVSYEHPENLFAMSGREKDVTLVRSKNGLPILKPGLRSVKSVYSIGVLLMLFFIIVQGFHKALKLLSRLDGIFGFPVRIDVQIDNDFWSW